MEYEDYFEPPDEPWLSDFFIAEQFGARPAHVAEWSLLEKVRIGIINGARAQVRKNQEIRRKSFGK